MSKPIQFGLYETVSLISIATVSKIFYTSISVIIETVGTAAWYSTFLSSVVSLLLFLIVYLLMKRFSGKNITEIFEIVLGKFIGKIISLLFCIYSIFYAGSSLREFVEMIKIYNLPYTPPSFIIGTFMAVVVLIAYYGLEGVARISAIFFIPILAGLAIILILTIPYYDFSNLLPIGGYGIVNTISYGLKRSSAYDEAIILAFIISSTHGLKIFKRAGVISISLSGLAISVSVLLNIAAFEYTVASENTSTIFEMARIIYFNRFFQRVESIFLFTWVIASVITVAIAFYIAIHVYCKTLRVTNHRPIILPFSFLLFMVAIYPENISQVIEINIRIMREYSFIFVYGVPILVLIISLLRGKKGGMASENKG